MTTQPGTPPGASSFRFFDGQFTANPFPIFAQMRSMGAVVQVPLPFGDGTHKAWMVTRMEEAVQVLKDKRFTVDRSVIDSDDSFRQRAEQAGNPPRFIDNSMISVDEPDHRHLRGLVSLDIARSLNRHIAFGQGIHICLGTPLARLEGDIAFTTLLRRMPNLRLNVPRETISWRGNFTLRGLNSLPVAF